MSTAEVENALTQHSSVAECAVVAAPHDIKGEVPVAFVVLRQGQTPSKELETELTQQVVKSIGPTAKPGKIVLTDALPKTRSGKIMRRILKAIVKGEAVGDVTTLMNPEAVQDLKEKVEQ
jgi:acetyl-CoA synthetase